MHSPNVWKKIIDNIEVSQKKTSSLLSTGKSLLYGMVAGTIIQFIGLFAGSTLVWAIGFLSTLVIISYYFAKVHSKINREIGYQEGLLEALDIIDETPADAPDAK